MTDLWVDTRWEGRHGIGRYAREVCSRLTLPWHPIGLRGSPSSPKGALVKVPEGPIYSPGYNAFLRADRQLLTIHDLIHLQTAWPGRAKYLAYYNFIVKPTVKRAGSVITVSETSRSAIAEWLNDSSVEIVNAGIGASPAFHRDVPPASASAPYLMYVGNLRAHKNLQVILDAMVNIPNAHLRVLIPSREHPDARTTIAARELEDRVEILPQLTDEELASQYRGASATVMPSTREGFGLPALESIMTGTPVMCWAGCTAVAETVGSRGQALLSATDTREWSSVLAHVLANPYRVEPPVGRYDWATTARRIEHAIKSFNA